VEPRVGDRVFYEGKTWRVFSLGQDAYQRAGRKMVANGELHAVLLLEANPPGSQPPLRAILPKSRWDEVRLLEG
jgi:hypothetical protein